MKRFIIEKKSFKTFFLFMSLLFSSSCSGDYRCMIIGHENGKRIIVLKNNIFGKPTVNQFNKFCLYGALLYEYDNGIVWSINSKSGLCKNMQFLSIYHTPPGFSEYGTFTIMPGKVYRLKLSLAGGQAESTIKTFSAN